MHRDQQKVFVASIINCPLATKPKSNTPPPPNTNIITHHRPIRFKSRISNRQKKYLRQSLFLYFFFKYSLLYEIVWWFYASCTTGWTTNRYPFTVNVWRCFSAWLGTCTHTCPSLAKHLVSFDPNLCHLEECKSSYKNLLHPFDIAYLLSRVAWLACLGQSDDLGKLRQ